MSSLSKNISRHEVAFDLVGSYGFACLGLKTGQHFFVSKKDDTPMINYIVRY